MSLLDTASLVITPNGTKAGKLYSVVPSSGAGDMTVTRATTATRVNSAGLIESVASNVPRLDYSNGTCPSILVEPQRTNLLIRSEEFDNVAWTKGNSSITANAINSPSGTLTADKLVENTSNSSHLLETVLATSIGQAYTLTCFFKKAERNFAYVGAYTNESKQVYINLTTGAVTNTVGTLVSYKVDSLANGWFRVSLTFTATTEVYPFFGISDNGTNLTYTGDGTSGIYIWGAQLEAGSYATSYIPTTSASVTRNADVIKKTGISSLIGQTEGTLFVDFNKTKTYGSSLALPVIIYDSANGINNRIQFLISNDLIELYATDGTNVVYSGGITTLTNGRYKIAVSYGSNGYRVYLNGSSVYTNLATFIPVLNSMRLGSFVTDIAFMSDSINQSTLWKTQLTNTQLAQLTTI